MKNYIMIASKQTSAFGGIAIYAVEYGIDDAVLVGDEMDGVRSIPRFSRLRYNMQGEAYFMHHGRREYLRDYMRINYPA